MLRPVYNLLNRHTHTHTYTPTYFAWVGWGYVHNIIINCGSRDPFYAPTHFSTRYCCINLKNYRRNWWCAEVITRLQITQCIYTAKVGIPWLLCLLRHTSRGTLLHCQWYKYYICNWHDVSFFSDTVPPPVGNSRWPALYIAGVLQRKRGHWMVRDVSCRVGVSEKPEWCLVV